MDQLRLRHRRTLPRHQTVGPPSPLLIAVSYMGFAKDLTGNYQRGLVTLSIPMLIAAAIMYSLRSKTRPTEPDLSPLSPDLASEA
jgi:hypothetical protein